MTKTQTAMIMAILQIAFPAYYRNISAADAKSAVALWAEMFADDDADDVTAAVKTLIATQVQGYPPTIGAVKAQLARLRDPTPMSDVEAWQRVKKAIANSGYRAAEEYDALPPICQRLVGSPHQLWEWGMLDAATVESVIASNFARSYRARAAAEQEYAAIPMSVRQQLESYKIKKLGD